MSADQHFDKHLIVATAGHVDHGKSALVKALTGTDTDRLPEEKLRSITIDLGFAHLKLSSPAPDSGRLLLGVVDVPGHEDFVKNMVAGVGSVDLALLAVAANDGWMPQTEEHMQILAYLGVRHAVVALTKIDLARDEQAAIAAIREKLLGTPFAASPIVSTSVRNGRGLDDLQSTLARVAAEIPRPSDFGKPRLPIDRVFTLKGIGTIVTGTLAGGTLHRGQGVVLQPSGRPARIRNIQCYNNNVESISPGSRTGLNLPDVAALEDVQRGNVVTLGSLGTSSKTIDVVAEISPRANHSLNDGARVWVHHGTGNVAARIVLLDRTAKLAAGESALAQLRLESPAFAFAGDRCILRDWAEQSTLAGAVVLDPDASRHGHSGDESRLAYLRQRAQAPDDARVFLESQVARDRVARASQLLMKSRFSSEQVAAAVARLVLERKIVATASILVDAKRWQRAFLEAADAIDVQHRLHPQRAGLPLTELRAALSQELSHEEIFDALIADLCKQDFARTGAEIYRRTHKLALPVGLQAACTKLRRTFRVQPFDPPSRNQLAPDVVSQQALHFLIDTGEAVELSREVVMAVEDVTRAAAAIREYIGQHGPATVSDLRQALGSSRRVVVPLLEHFDREGMTLRQSDKRVLRAQSAAGRARAVERKHR